MSKKKTAGWITSHGFNNLNKNNLRPPEPRLSNKPFIGNSVETGNFKALNYSMTVARAPYY